MPDRGEDKKWRGWPPLMVTASCWCFRVTGLPDGVKIIIYSKHTKIKISPSQVSAHKQSDLGWLDTSYGR